MSTHNKQDAEGKKIKEKRAYPRLVCHEPTFYSIKSGVYEGIIRDRDKEGVKGIFIATSEHLAIGEVITVAISSPGEKEGKKLKGMIARKEPGGYAVQFLDRLNI
ncbi:MAG: PilZ domain-containing protein [Thermodesulfobacteriota bacterium]|nr:PilZ domain-containing protein [Thermodesulfobacteriota bacterium]